MKVSLATAYRKKPASLDKMHGLLADKPRKKGLKFRKELSDRWQIV